MKEDWYSMKTVCINLQLSRNTILAMVERGELIAWQPKPHAPWRFDIESVNEYYRKQHKMIQ